MIPARNLPFAAGLLSDAAYSYWRANDAIECVKSLAEAWVIVDKLPVGKSDLEAFRARKSFGHIVLWISNVLYEREHEDPHAIPQAGFASYPEVQEHWRDLPEGNPEILPILLAGVAVRLKQDVGLLEWLAPRAAKVSAPGGQAMLRGILVRRAFLRCEVETLPILENDLRTATRSAFDDLVNRGLVGADKSREELKHFPLNSKGFGADVFLTAMVVLAGAGRSCLQHIDVWQSVASTLPNSTDLKEWLQQAASWFENTCPESEQTLRSANVSWAQKMATALQLATCIDTTPTQLIGAHCILFDNISHSVWLRDVEDAFASIVVRGWQRAAKNRWMFRFPQQVPDILKQCDSGESGLKKIARVLNAAIRSAPCSISSDLRQLIQTYALNAS